MWGYVFIYFMCLFIYILVNLNYIDVFVFLNIQDSVLFFIKVEEEMDLYTVCGVGVVVFLVIDF